MSLTAKDKREIAEIAGQTVARMLVEMGLAAPAKADEGTTRKAPKPREEWATKSQYRKAVADVVRATGDAKLACWDAAVVKECFEAGFTPAECALTLSV